MWYIFSMAWTFLGIAIVCEVLATTALKLSNGFSHAWWTIASVSGYALAFVMLSLSVKTLPLGLAYAIWAGVGTVTVFLISIIAFKSGAQPIAWVGVVLVAVGIIFLNIGSTTHA
jgi:small multidrug resistance pump